MYAVFLQTVKQIPWYSFIFLGLFVIASIVELIFAFKEKEKQRRIVKPFVMLFLGFFAVCAFPNMPFIYIGCFLSLIGDIFVLFKTPIAYIGLLSFLLAHISYAIQAIGVLLNNSVSTGGVVLFVVFFVVIFISSYALVFHKVQKNFFEGFMSSFYISMLLTMIPIMSYTTAHIGVFMFLGIIGYVLFVSSDIILITCRFYKTFKKYDFYIMLTYICAELLIVLGFVLTAYCI